MMNNKIFTVNNFEKIVKNLKSKRKSIVLCHGVFDLLHIGHIKHLEFAKKSGEILVVSLTKDKFINKGLGRPVFNQNIRAEMVSNLSLVDYVVINDLNSAEDILTILKPNFYCKGIEYKEKKNDFTKKIYSELEILKKNRGKIIYSDEKTYSSSKIINDNMFIYNIDQTKFIRELKKNISLDNVINAFSDLKKLRALILGEIIIDNYIFAEPIGKSSKDTMLVLKEENSKMFVGGAGSVAKNVQNFTKNKVELISYIGEKKQNIKLIKKYLGSEIKQFLICKKNSPTILKKRYIDRINNSKLIGVYNFNNSNLTRQEENKIKIILNKLSKKNDLIIVNDFSHGLVTKNIFNQLKNKTNFLSLNSQVNSSNYGFYSMKNFNNIDCLSINEREIRYELRDKTSDIKDIMKRLSKSKNIKNVLVTRGADGVILYNKKKNKFFKCPAFATNILDKIGTGDTIHGIFSLCLKCKVDFNLSLLISSLAAAKNIKGYANENLVHPEIILKEISHMIK